MALSNAERQAAYRARKRGEVAPEQPDPPEARLRARILELEEEVRHLKSELAHRHVVIRAAPNVTPVVVGMDNPVTAAWGRSRPVPKRG